MNYFFNKTARELSDLHNQAFQNTSKATKSTFLQSLKRVEKIYDAPLPELQFSFIVNPEEFIQHLTTSNYSENTKLTTITSIIKLLRIIDAPQTLLNKWLVILKERTEARQNNDNIILKKKLQVLLDYKDIRKMVEEKAETYLNDNEQSFKDFQQFLIVAFFTLQIPVRISNYINMVVASTSEADDGTNNLLVIDDDKYELIFNKYRTSHMLGKKTMLIKNETLQFLIDKWLSKYNKVSTNLFIVSQENKRSMNGRQIKQIIESSTKDIFGSALNVDNIRASYMRYISELDPDFQDKLDIANILGYKSPNTIDKHSTEI
jgi:hypothetical protein